MLLRPLPVTDPSTAWSWCRRPISAIPGNLPLSHLNFKDLRAQNAVFTDMASLTFNQVNYSHGQESEQIPVQIVTGQLLLPASAPSRRSGAGSAPTKRRRPRPSPSSATASGSAASDRDPSAVGKTLTLNRTPYTIVGVAPKHFTGVLLGGGPSVWLPMSRNIVVQPTWYETRRGLFLFSVARLKPGVTAEQARANLKTVFANLEQAFPVDNHGPQRHGGAARSRRA